MTFGIRFHDTVTILIMTILIITVVIMTIRITLDKGNAIYSYITYSDVAYDINKCTFTHIYIISIVIS